MRLDALFNDPRNWLFDKSKFPEVRIRDLLVSWFSGGTPSSSEATNWNGDILWASPKDFSDDIVITDTEDRITETGQHAARLSLAQPGTVLLVVRSGILKHTLPVMVCSREMTVNQDVKALVLKSVISPLFFAEYLQVHQSRILPLITKHGTTVQSVNTNEFERLLIPLPPLDTQRALVAEMETARESRGAKVNEADALLKSLDNSLLSQFGLEPPPTDARKVFAVRLGSIRRRFDVHANHPRFVKLFQQLSSHKFSIFPLKALALDIFSGTTPLSGGDAYTDATQGIPFVRSGEITKDGLVADVQEVFLKPEVHNGLMKRSQLKENDLLIAIVGATIGAVGVYNHSYPANINQAIAAVRLDTQRILPAFVRWYLSTSIGQAILDFLKRPVARANINLEEIGEIPVLVPPLEVQQSIIEQVDKKRAEAHRLRAEAEAEWEAAKERFEHQLLTGK